MAINWGDVIKSTLATVGGSVVLLGAVAWLIKAVISQALVLQTEMFKMRLKAEADIEIEKLKNALQITAVEHQVRFVNLHEKRAEFIAELYNDLVEAVKDSQLFVREEWSRDDKAEQQEAFRKTHDMILNLYWFVEKHRYYLPLPGRVYDLLSTFIDNIEHHVVSVGVYGSSAIDYPKDLAARKDRHDAIIRAYDAFKGNIPELRKALEDELRKILGVEESASPAGQQSNITISPPQLPKA